MANRGEKKHHIVRNTTISAAIVAAALWFFGGGGSGLMGGQGLSFGGAGESAAPETEVRETGEREAPEVTPTQEEAAAPQEGGAEDDGVLRIVVRESDILYEGEETDLTALEEALLRDYRKGMPVTLEDDHAIKATYDEVTALLQRLDIPLGE